MSWASCDRSAGAVLPGADEIAAVTPPAPRGKVLLFSYAFPPMQVQMTPAVLKPMAAFAELGYAVDVLCADSFSPHLPLDTSLLPYAESAFRRVTRLRPPRGIRGFLQRHSEVLTRVPDLMTVLHQPAYEYLMDADLGQYDAVMTWSPFHSINSVMVRVKKHRKDLPWIAQFSDPWAGNPLEVSELAKAWNRWHEPRAVNAANFIVHSSPYSLELMLRDHPPGLRKKADVLPHVFNRGLYPSRPKAANSKITLRYLGVLYGRRSPEPLFLAINRLCERRRDIAGMLAIELIGHVPAEMLQTAAARALPAGTVINVPNVSYLKSLELMYDADILLLIEADIRSNLFLPSKLADYLGADTPIVGFVPPGASEDALVGLDCWRARPSDVPGITNAIEAAVDYVLSGQESRWCDESFKLQFSAANVAQQFAKIVGRLT